LVTLIYPKEDEGHRSQENVAVQDVIHELEAARDEGYNVFQQVIDPKNATNHSWRKLLNFDEIQEDDVILATPTGLGG